MRSPISGIRCGGSSARRRASSFTSRRIHSGPAITPEQRPCRRTSSPSCRGAPAARPAACPTRRPLHPGPATARVAVLRLHGRNAHGWLRQLRGEEPWVREKYDYLYSEGELRELLPEIEAVREETEEVFISFNNNNRDYPVQNALMLKRLLGQPIPAASPHDLFT